MILSGFGHGKNKDPHRDRFRPTRGIVLKDLHEKKSAVAERGSSRSQAESSRELGVRCHDSGGPF